MQDAWQWKAHYADGSTVAEIDPDGGDHGFAEIDLDRLVAFELVPQRAGLVGHVLKVTADGDFRPIFFRRRCIAVDPVTGHQEPQSTIHCLGWQRTIHGVNVQSFTFLFEDGSVLVTDDREAV